MKRKKKKQNLVFRMRVSGRIRWADNTRDRGGCFVVGKDGEEYHLSRYYSYQKWPADAQSVVIATESYRSEFAGDSILCLFKPKDPKSEKLEKVWLIWNVPQYSGEDVKPRYEVKDSPAADWIRLLDSIAE